MVYIGYGNDYYGLRIGYKRRSKLDYSQMLCNPLGLGLQ